jgi:hypothetical protein
MPATARRRFAEHPFVPALLLAVLAAQIALTIRMKTPTFDEPAHIGAGLSYLETGEFKINLQHPPLLKEIGALPLLAMGTYWPMDAQEWAALGTKQDAWFQWQLGRQVIMGGGPDRVLLAARLPFALITLMLGGLIYAWGRRLLGGTAAAGGLLLFCLDPTIVAHGPLVATDAGFAAFGFLFLFALRSYLEHRSARRLLGCGLALGAGLASKFSGLVLLPMCALLLVWANRWIPAAMPMRASSIADPYASADGTQRIIWTVWAMAAMGAVAALLIHALYFFPGNPFLYLEGFRRVNADHDPTYWPYMAGQFQPRFWSYYVVAYFLKEPLPSIVLASIGLAALLRRGAATTMDRAFLILPPAVLLIAYTALSHNLGFRYLIPALPFLHLLGGFGIATLFRGREDGGAWWKRVVALALCAWLVVAAAGIFPDHLSYFNEAACLLAAPSRIGPDGGTSCGPLWLDDSNVDWGQGLKQLKAWIDRNTPGRPYRLAYFGSMRPEDYGLAGVRIGVGDLLVPPPPGLHAVSAHYLARAIGELSRRHGDGPGNWILRTRPTAVVGHAFYIFDVPGPPAS